MALSPQKRAFVWITILIVPAFLVYAYFSNIEMAPHAEIIEGAPVQEDRPVQAPPHIPVPSRPVESAVSETPPPQTFEEPQTTLPPAEETKEVVDVGVPVPPPEPPPVAAPTAHPLKKFCDTATSEVAQEILDYPYESDNTEFENYQYRDPEGKTIRMHISPSVPNDSASPSIARFFNWDNKNNSMPIETPMQFQGKSVAEILNSPEFSNPSYHDRKFSRTYPEGFTAIVRTANKDLETFESVNKGFKIRCFRGLKCSCQTD